MLIDLARLLFFTVVVGSGTKFGGHRCLFLVVLIAEYYLDHVENDMIAGK